MKDDRKCLVERVQHPQRSVSTGGLGRSDAERQSKQNAEKTMLINCAPDNAANLFGGTHALEERHDRTAGFDRLFAGELLAERRGGALPNFCQG